MTPGEGSWHVPSPVLSLQGRRPGNDGLRQKAGLACRVSWVATEGPGASLATVLTEHPPQRIQFLDEVIGVLVVLGEEAEGHGCHRVVAPGAVQAAEEVSAFLGKEGAIGAGSPAAARTWH